MSPSPVHDQTPSEPQAHTLLPGGRWRYAVPAAAALLLLGAAVLSRGSEPAASTDGPNLPVVALVQPGRAPAREAVVLPAGVRAVQDTPIYARTSGYLKRWTVDLGARVKAGQLLAEIDTPEVDESLRQARAALQRAEADAELARVTAARWQELARTHAVASQDVDQKQADLHVKLAVLEGARAEVARLGELESFKRVTAPFAGVITARRVDVGALVSAGSSGGVTELFHLTQDHALRVSADVPQAYAALARVGQAAELDLGPGGGKPLAVHISRRAEAMDPATRTLHVELDVDNAQGRVLPGASAQLRFDFQDPSPALTLPVTALLYRPTGPAVAVVDAGHRATLVPVVLGRNDGRRVQVLQGLSGGEHIALDPPDALASGDRVRVATATQER